MLTARKILLAVALAAAAASLAIAPAAAQSREQLIERFRGECRAQFAHLRGKGQQDVVRAHVHGCVVAKMRAQASARTNAVVSSGVAIRTSAGAELKLPEATPWLVQPPRGPAEAKGVIYFVRGWGYPRGVPGAPRGGEQLDRFRGAHYLLKTLSENGWDVISAKFPYRPTSQYSFEFVPGAAAFVKRRVRELKEQGYRRVIIAGPSWGAWIAMVVERGEPHADAILVMVPNTFGARTLRSGRVNPNFAQNAAQFALLVKDIKTPTVLVNFAGDPYENGEGDLAKRAFERNKLVHLLISKPAGFTGHTAHALPIFDYAFGKCIGDFLENASAIECQPPPLVNSDFRSIVSVQQVADAKAKQVSSADALAGRKFFAYKLSDRGGENSYYDYTAADRRTNLRAEAESRESVAFRDGLRCVAGTCSRLIQWADGQILEFDPKTGNLRAWWVEVR